MSEIFVEDLQNARKKLIAKRRALAAEMARAPAVSPASAHDFTLVQEGIMCGWPPARKRKVDR
jgi:hypothetical protein